MDTNVQPPHVSVLQDMLELQDQMNTQVHPNWRDQHNPWYRAIWTECAELMDHHGWKWWKQQHKDIGQIKLELVDIWHFGLSIWLQQDHPLSALAEQIAQEWDTASSPEADSDSNANETFLAYTEQLAATALTQQRLSVVHFRGLMTLIDMDMQELARMYIGKNVLNIFRQDHGYKEGTYQKTWQGKEDNEVLIDVLNSLDGISTGLKSAVYSGLESRYPK